MCPFNHALLQKLAGFHLFADIGDHGNRPLIFTAPTENCRRRDQGGQLAPIYTAPGDGVGLFLPQPAPDQLVNDDFAVLLIEEFNNRMPDHFVR